MKSEPKGLELSEGQKKKNLLVLVWWNQNIDTVNTKLLPSNYNTS